MDMNNHIVKEDDSKPLHSSGLARVAVGDRVGSVNSISFGQRQQTNRERRLVYGYSRSMIGSTRGVMRAKPVLDANGIVTSPSLQKYNSSNSARPTPQSYNPYA
jgi:hypothetical protein